jgi:glutaredoxin
MLIAFRWFFALFAAAALLVAVACHKKKDEAAGAGPDPAASVAAAFVVKPDSQGLLLTWIDDKGEFHVEDKVADVPLTGRDAVRVVDPTRDEGTSTDDIFVADLRQTRPDGTYPVTTMTRDQFERLATARREKNGPVLANAPPVHTPPAPPGASAAPSPGDTSTHPTVIIYGAEWCGACKQAKAYLSRRKVAFIEKDVDDEKVQKELVTKMMKAHLQYNGSIPVLDVRGQMLVGFNPQVVDDALGSAL